MASKSIHLSRLSNQQMVESESSLKIVEQLSGQRLHDGTYEITTGDETLVSLDPQMARRFAEHVIETDEHAQELDHDNR